MKTQMLWMTALLGLSLVITGCDKNKGEKPKSEMASVAGFERFKRTKENAEIKVVNQFGEPIANAQILIGDAQGTPFRGNFITTNAQGMALVPREWTTPASLTVAAQGYVRKTILKQTPANFTIYMSTAYLNQYAEVKGKVNNLPVVDGDKLIDFAMAMPVLSRADLINFDFNQVISPFNDKLSAAGQESNIPSNISLPKQKESYIISVTLDKPVYRLKVPTIGQRKFVATRGRFVFKTVAGELRNGKKFHELINHFSILGAGLKDAMLTGPVTNLDIPGNELNFSSVIQVNPTSSQADEIALVLATSDMSGMMVPTDIKRVTNGKPTALQALPNQPSYIVNMIKKQSEFMSQAPGADRMTASVLPYSAASQYKLLPLIGNPSITNRENYIINLPAVARVEGINPVATTAMISDLTEVREGDTVVMTPIRKWEVTGFGWDAQISLPKWPLDSSTTRKRVEVNYIGSSTSDAANTLENATHVTHASTDF